MELQEIKDLVNLTEKTPFHKNQLVFKIKKSFEIFDEYYDKVKLIREIENSANVDSILVSSDDCIIYKIKIDGTCDKWDIKYPFRCILKVENDKWITSNCYYVSLEDAMLGFLQTKYLRSESDFTLFAKRMLGMPEENNEDDN